MRPDGHRMDEGYSPAEAYHAGQFEAHLPSGQLTTFCLQRGRHVAVTAAQFEQPAVADDAHHCLHEELDG